MSNTVSYVQVSITTCEVSFREESAFLAAKWKAKRCLKLVLFSAATNIILGDKEIISLPGRKQFAMV